MNRSTPQTPPKDHSVRIIGDYLWDRRFAQAIDRLTSERFKIPPVVLMEAAGKAVAQLISETSDPDSPVIVLAGSGNNGADALVTARHLAEAGFAVAIFLVPTGRDGAESDLYRAQLETLTALGHRPQPYAAGALRRWQREEPIIVDGVYGLGFAGPLEDGDATALAFAALSEAGAIPDATVFAVDLPSGLDADSGAPQEIPLPADVTVTFGGKKPAQLLAPARDACGEVILVDIGYPQAALDAATEAHRPLIMEPDAAELLAVDSWAQLAKSSHKFDRGHVLVIGGSAGKTGAPLIAALASLRAGAGWATVAMPQSALATLKGDVPKELTFEALFDGETLNAINLERFLEKRQVRAVVIGPGSVTSPLNPEAMAILMDHVAERRGFVVLDAGATHDLAALLQTTGEADPERWLATPHPGEWRRLGPEFDFEPLTPEGVAQASRAAEHLGLALLYKHATPLLFTGNPKTPAFVVAEGTLALARAGSGDVLAGVIGAHGAIGLSTAVAALRGQIQVAWAARLAAEAVGEQAVLARDIVDHLGKAVAQAKAALTEEEED